MTLRDLDAHESQYGHLMNDPVNTPESYCEHCETPLLPSERQLCKECEEELL